MQYHMNIFDFLEEYNINNNLLNQCNNISDKKEFINKIETTKIEKNFEK